VVLMQRWRARARRLFRDGLLIEASFFELRQVKDDNGSLHTECRYRFVSEGKLVTFGVLLLGEQAAPELPSLTVLYHPELAFGAVFPHGTFTILGRGRLRSVPVPTGALV